MSQQLTRAHCVAHGVPEEFCTKLSVAGFSWGQVLAIGQTVLEVGQQAWPVVEADIAAGKGYLQIIADVLAVVGKAIPATV